MKAWITKYALTEGILETEINCQDHVVIEFENGMILSTSDKGKHWHTSFENAKLRAEEMRRKKIESLKKQIEKLERMKFD